MAASSSISPQFLVWCECVLVWIACSYGVMSDPLRGEQDDSQVRYWAVLGARGLTGFALGYLLSRSIILAGVLLVLVCLQPVFRWQMRPKRVAEFETFWSVASVLVLFELIQVLGLNPRWTPHRPSPPQLASLCIIAGCLLFVLRGGTYIVRGILKKAGTSPRRPAPDNELDYGNGIDIKEYNRGRLIGELERIVLVIVIAGGSYAALAFLVAAKGLVRSEQFQKSSEFAEYFLIGSLTSVLVSLCVGIALRLALLRLWPELLNFRIQ